MPRHQPKQPSAQRISPIPPLKAHWRRGWLQMFTRVWMYGVGSMEHLSTHLSSCPASTPPVSRGSSATAGD